MYIYTRKKKSFSLHPFVFKFLIPVYICYLFEFKYFNYVYQRKKNHYLSRTKGKRKKKKPYYHHSFVFKCLIPICICYLFEFKYFNYLYKKNRKLLIPKKKKKKPLPYVKTTHFYPKISMIFCNSLKHSKIFVIQILYSYHKSPSIHTDIYHISFEIGRAHV